MNAVKEQHAHFGVLYIFDSTLCFDLKMFAFNKQMVIDNADIVSFLRSEPAEGNANTVEVQSKGQSVEHASGQFDLINQRASRPPARSSIAGSSACGRRAVVRSQRGALVAARQRLREPDCAAGETGSAPSRSTARYLEWLSLNVHFHMLFLDGVYVDGANGSRIRFRWVKAPTSEELAHLTHTIARRVGRCLERQGLLER